MKLSSKTWCKSVQIKMFVLRSLVGQIDIWSPVSLITASGPMRTPGNTHAYNCWSINDFSWIDFKNSITRSINKLFQRNWFQKRTTRSNSACYGLVNEFRLDNVNNIKTKIVIFANYLNWRGSHIFPFYSLFQISHSLNYASFD